MFQTQQERSLLWLLHHATLGSSTAELSLLPQLGRGITLADYQAAASSSPCSRTMNLVQPSALLRSSTLQGRPIVRTVADPRTETHAVLQQLLSLQQVAAAGAVNREIAAPPTRKLLQPTFARIGATDDNLHHKRQQALALNQLNQKKVQEEEDILKKMGSTLRDTYADVSRVSLGPSSPSSKADEPRKRNSPNKTFTKILHSILRNERYSHIVSFRPHGRAFCVYDQEAFANVVMPAYFKRSKSWGSFSRQLSLYGFRRINAGPDVGGYYHELFLQGRPELAAYMGRVGIPAGGGRDRRRERSQRAKREDPDFYAMAPCTNRS